MAEIERVARARAGMGLAKGVRPRPIEKRGFRAPKRVRGVQHVIVALGAFQEMKGDESRHGLEMAVARQPDLLEIVLGCLLHFVAIHGDEHARSPSVTRPRIAEKARSSRAFARIGTNP